ncbi:PPOX class F420-dependent oxidoreductase [Actinophytocola sp.]|uniref:PPOX class F420-dependent oxidoreductase n=1 Tax=Actinophytocola sp. TaxID=1872138 RepID=UPI002ED0341A
MATFTDTEIEYLTSQPLGRFATVGKDGRPHVTPVGVFCDTDTLVIGCVATMTATKKFRDVLANPDVAVVVDDLATVDPWAPRGIEIRGWAEALMDGGGEVGRLLGAGFPFDEVYLRIHPRRIVAWGLDGAAARDVV